MKLLNGSDIADFIKARQVSQFKNLRTGNGNKPKLVIVRMGSNRLTDKYLELKQAYGRDVGALVEVKEVTDQNIEKTIQDLNQDTSCHGIVVQLPLEGSHKTELALAMIAAEKDIDGLSPNSGFIPATAQAIDRLLAGYNVNLKDKKITIVGNGRLVGAPLAKLWRLANLDVTVCDINTKDLGSVLLESDIVVSATGQAGLIKPEMLKKGSIVVDAGTSTSQGKIVGDLDETVYSRDDLTITPVRGGVGPLTIASLFDNLLEACCKK